MIFFISFQTIEKENFKKLILYSFYIKIPNAESRIHVHISLNKTCIHVNINSE